MPRPNALPLPAQKRVSAFTKPEVYDQWGSDAAGVRALLADDATITMFDVVGEDYWTGGGITAKKVAEQLRAIGDRPATIQINSPGGDMFEGIAVYNVLREHPQDITVQVMGMAASAASIIAMAGDKIEIGAASFMMIHNCWVLAMGNRNDMRDLADWLEPFDSAMASLYTERTGNDAAQVAAWMDKETYMSGAQAIERGFADALLPADAMKVDEATKAADRSVNELRAMELTLVHAGATRTQARERINKIKGTPGAARDDATPGAGSTDWMLEASALLNSLRA
ncbi:head maturation protease, ClpP-related [Novosphingobium sp. BW1]|uniref:head maturation protease, ClpP-related n=1 Tax=Novosphingobium sp. BW1 TaxID=2592621 RepID=UPI0011DE821F|nr:head maturation protease, ClpP-related [Novosphingobium sp. BW1]TYC93040.1 Clp protease ClpP [Novosphingobium sp. BW1]